MAIKPKINTELSIPASGIMNETFLVAGFKVIDKAGGPTLLVVGFTYQEDTIIPPGVIKFKGLVFLKVFLNIQRKPKNLLYLQSTSNSISTYHFFYDIADDWAMSRASNDRLYLICKYWSPNDEKFIYTIKTVIEVDMVNPND